MQTSCTRSAFLPVAVSHCREQHFKRPPWWVHALLVWHVINIAHLNTLLSCRILIAPFVICTNQSKPDLPCPCHWYFPILSNPDAVSCLLFLLCLLLNAKILQGQAALPTRNWSLRCLWWISIIFVGWSSQCSQEEKVSLGKAQEELLPPCHLPDAERMDNSYSFHSYPPLVRTSRYRCKLIRYVLGISNPNVGSAMRYCRVCHGLVLLFLVRFPCLELICLIQLLFWKPV